MVDLKAGGRGGGGYSCSWYVELDVVPLSVLLTGRNCSCGFQF